MLHTVFLVISGMVLVGILSAILEMLGMRNHYWAVTVAAVCVIGAAWAHSWTRLLIGMGLAVLYLMLRRDWEKRAERKGKSEREGTTSHLS